MEGLYTYTNIEEFLKDYDKLTFPYMSLYYTDDDKKAMMKRLSSYDHKARLQKNVPYTVKNLGYPQNAFLFKGEHLILMSDEKDYKDFNILSNLFIEDVRMRCKVFGSQMSPMEYYQKYRRKLAEACLQKYKKITPHFLRETLWGVRIARECTTFRPTNLVAMIQMFFPNYKKSPIRILDPSAGWGDRLLAAMSTKSTYYGVDPNPKLHPYYEKMIKFFGGSKQKYKMLQAPFEEAKLTKTKYDMVFTSPPYFDLEHYSDHKDQSDVKNTTEREWFDNFLKLYIMTAWEALRDGGYMVMIINQKNSREHYVGWMLDFVCEFGNYMGVIAYAKPGEPRSSQPMFIWQKTDLPPILETERLTMRKFTIDDAKDFAALQSDSDNMKNLGSGRVKSVAESTEQLTRYIEEYSNETYARFNAIELDGDIIGYCGYYNGEQFNHPMLQRKNLLRILIDKKHRGKKYASEIVHEFLKKYARKHIHMMVEVNNAPSNKLFARYMRRSMQYKGKKYYLYDSQSVFKGGRRKLNSANTRKYVPKTRGRGRGRGRGGNRGRGRGRAVRGQGRCSTGRKKS